MISFWYRLSEHDGSRAHLLVNPPDIGLTEPVSNFRSVFDPVRRPHPDRAPEH
jgi:hypothetical protein